MKLVLGLAMSAALCSAAAAQEADRPSLAASAPPANEASPTPASSPLASPDAATLPAGTLVDIEVGESLNSKVRVKGDKFAIRLAQPIVANGRVLVPAGTTGVGEVVSASHAGAMGKGGELLLAARYLDYAGQKIPLRAFKLGASGKDNLGTIATVDFVAGFAGPVGVGASLLSLAIPGGDIEIKSGTPANAKLAADLTLPLGEAVTTSTAPSSSAQEIQ